MWFVGTLGGFSFKAGIMPLRKEYHLYERGVLVTFCHVRTIGGGRFQRELEQAYMRTLNNTEWDFSRDMCTNVVMRRLCRRE